MPEPNRPSPYVGLQPYREGDRMFFFGREDESRIIISNLYAAPLTILYGASGVGKSSLLRAGVVPDLRREAAAVLIFAEWHAPEFLTRIREAAAGAVAAASGAPFDIGPFGAARRTARRRRQPSGRTGTADLRSIRRVPPQSSRCVSRRSLRKPVCALRESKRYRRRLSDLSTRRLAVPIGPFSHPDTVPSR